MNNIAYEYKFIFFVLCFYGILFLFYTLNGNSLYGLSLSQLTFTQPSQPSGNVIYDFISGASSFISTMWGFFSTLLITPFTANVNWAWFGFINWAMFGTTLYILIRIIRGGG